MAQDNTVGAPTEGLGQTVTFTAPGGGSSQARAGGRGRLNNDMRGGEQSLRNRLDPLPIHQGPDPTMVLLQKMGNAILQPHLEKERTERFVQGMQQAAQGQAITEIVDEQPWYSKIFGDTHVIDGARAFSSYAKVQEEATAVESDMDNLRTKSPQEAQKYFADRIAKAQTGDSGTDAMVMQHLTKEMPSMMKRHAKEHFAWQQENFAKSVQSAQSSAASNLAVISGKFAKRHANPEDVLTGINTVDIEDIAQAKDRFVQSFLPPAGMPEATYQKLTGASVGALLTQDNLHAYHTLDQLGVIDGLGPEVSARLRKQAESTEDRVRSKMPQSLVDELAKIRALPTADREPGQLEEIRRRVERLNSSFMSITGSSQPLINGSTEADLQSGLLKGLIRDEYQARDKAAVAEAKATTVADKAAAFEHSVTITSGQMRQGANVSDMKSEVREQAWLTLRSDPAAHRAALVLQADQGETDKVYQGQLRTKVGIATRANDPVGFDALYRNEFLPLVEAGGGNMATALSYLGNDYGKQMATYHMLVGKSDLPPDQKLSAYVAATAERGRAITDSKTDKSLTAAVKDLTKGEWLTFGDGLDDHRLQPLVELLARDVDHLGGSIPVDQRVKTAIANKKRDGLEIAGGHFWMTPQGVPSFLNAVQSETGANGPAVAGDEKDRAVRGAIKVVADKAGFTGDLQVFQNPQSKEPMLMVMGIAPDGQSRMVTLSAKEVASIWGTRSEWKDKPPVNPRTPEPSALDKALAAKAKLRK